MKPRDLLHETNSALLANKGRSALTILGIVIGITAAVVMVSLVGGFENWLEDNIGLGSARVITISANDAELSTSDVEFLERTAKDYDKLLPEVTVSSTTPVQSATSSDSEDVSLQVMGADPDYFDIQGISLASGTLYTADAGAAVVLSEDAVESIYGSSSINVVGQTIEIGGADFQIVGVTESSSSLLGSFSVNVAYVPYSTACQSLVGSEKVDSIVGYASEDADVEYLAARTEGLLVAKHKVEYDEDGEQDVYTASTSSSSLSNMSSFTVAFDALAGLVAGIALLVGGIGIMNMMLTNVTERMREIGLRKSLGARPRDIKMQFLAESVALCLTGGFIGIVVGVAGAFGIAKLVTRFYSDLAGLVPSVTPLLVIVVFLVCAAIGIIFGYYPASRGAKMNPTETLRYQ